MSEPAQIREMQPGDHAAVLALNNAAVPAVNPHDEDSFAELIAIADKNWVVADADGTIGGLLVAFAPGAGYESANYTWLSERYDDFRYVDRIVIAPSHKRQGLGARLYAELAAHGMSVGAARLLCEVNVEPANPQSLAFHADNGWVPIEDREHGPGKVVRYLQRLL